MASAVATPLENQFSTIAGIDSMTSTSTLRARPRSRCSSRSTATSTPRRRTCSRRSRLAAQAAAAEHADPADLAQGQPGRLRRSSILALSSPTLPLSEVDEYAETMLAQRFRAAPAWPRSMSTARRSTRCASRSIPTRSPRATSASTRSADGGRRPATSICRPARSNGPNQSMTIQANGQLMNAAAFTPTRSSPIATARRCASRTSAG